MDLDGITLGRFDRTFVWQVSRINLKLSGRALGIGVGALSSSDQTESKEKDPL